MHQKVVPDPFLVLVNNPKQPCMQKTILKIRYFERGLSKSLQKLTLFFVLNPAPFNWQSYQKQKGLGTINKTSLQNKFSKIPLLVIYYLTKFDDIRQCLSYSKNYIGKFMQANSWYHKLFHFHLCFWIWKVWKGREKITKIWISREQKELFRWNKK